MIVEDRDGERCAGHAGAEDQGARGRRVVRPGGGGAAAGRIAHRGGARDIAGADDGDRGRAPLSRTKYEGAPNCRVGWLATVVDSEGELLLGSGSDWSPETLAESVINPDAPAAGATTMVTIAVPPTARPPRLRLDTAARLRRHRALAGGGRDEGHARRQHVGRHDAGGGGGAVVPDGEGIGQILAERQRVHAPGEGQRQVDRAGRRRGDGHGGGELGSIAGRVGRRRRQEPTAGVGRRETEVDGGVARGIGHHRGAEVGRPSTVPASSESMLAKNSMR